MQGVNVQHQLFGGVPRIHEYGMKRQLLVIDNLVQHVAHMVKLGLAIMVRIINAVIDHPVLARLGVD